jgi:hypothetical protein
LTVPHSIDFFHQPLSLSGFVYRRDACKKNELANYFVEFNDFTLQRDFERLGVPSFPFNRIYQIRKPDNLIYQRVTDSRGPFPDFILFADMLKHEISDSRPGNNAKTFGKNGGESFAKNEEMLPVNLL